jgi:formylglycine-generating enzyme required for sulfatase activity
LNRKTGKNYRLPTEKEWEYAAEGGDNVRNYYYSGSDSIDLVAWHKGNSGGRTHPVGTKQPNELGIYDMSGNVYEWLADGGGNIRGGSWYFTAGFCVASSYYSDYVSIPRNNFLGFRLARDTD